jgi:Domain of unknown function (DUF4123)
LPDAAEAVRLHPRLQSLHAPDFGGTLYCVLDAAADAGIYPALRACAAEEKIASLYQGDAATELAAVAPYLAAPDQDGPLLDWLSGPAWETNWGIFLWSEAMFDEVRSHFRRLAKVRTEDGRTLLFRVYDPRVLSAFLPTCDPAQIREIFGPIVRFGATVPGTAGLELFAQRDGVIAHSHLAL